MKKAGGGGDKGTPSPDDDARAFEEAMRGTKPLDPAARRRRASGAGNPVAPPRRADPATRPPTHAEEDALLGDVVTGGGAFAVDITGEAIAARAVGIDARLLRRLRAGEYPIEATLDLHGRSRLDALAALERFLAAAQAQGRRCVLCIHGRGNRSAADGPVLKPAVWEWLTASRRAGSVMALASARPEHGGDGATLILLRRARAPR